ncbi:hypothetical protein HYU94_02885 [Candidatus Daviesbacteria bacterium]|nr:hypothetical protein [Candidatus Daviesbacteria bacterium]
MHRQKGLAPILIILLIALAVGGYLLYQKQLNPSWNDYKLFPISQPSPSPVTSPVASSSAETANWKTYTSSEYNPFFPDETIKKYNQTKQRDGYTNDENTKYIKFSIKYPANWQQGYFDDPAVGSGGKNSFIFSNGDYKITISKGYAPGGNSCDQKILKEILTQTSGFNLSRVKVFDSETGTFELCEKGGSNTQIGRIIYITPQNYDTKILDEMDQILSTFRFTQ